MRWFEKYKKEIQLYNSLLQPIKQQQLIKNISKALKAVLYLHSFNALNVCLLLVTRMKIIKTVIFSSISSRQTYTASLQHYVTVK